MNLPPGTYPGDPSAPWNQPEPADPPEFTMTIELGNAAMETPEDVADALRRAADVIEGASVEVGEEAAIRDLNGNAVGRWKVTS